MASPIEKAKEIIAKGEKARHGPWEADENEADHSYTACVAGADGDVFAQVGAILVDDNRAIDNAAYIAAANPAALLPLLRLLVECEPVVEYVAGLCSCGNPACGSTVARALLDKLRSES